MWFINSENEIIIILFITYLLIVAPKMHTQYKKDGEKEYV